jgi:hypothetical protein
VVEENVWSRPRKTTPIRKLICPYSAGLFLFKKDFAALMIFTLE